MINKILSISILFCCYMTNANAVKIGEIAPNCPTINQENKLPFQADLYKGKVVYLDFWASWCAPCRLSFPKLNKLYKELKSQGVEVIAINLDENRADAEKFLQENPVEFKIVYDDAKQCPKQYALIAMPSSYIIDKQGVIRMIHLGFKAGNEAKIHTDLLALLSE